MTIEKLNETVSLEEDKGRNAIFSKINKLIDEASVAELARGYKQSISASGAKITFVQKYPFLVPEHLKDFALDGRIRSKVAIPAGASISAITLNGASVAVSDKDLEGLKEVFLSELFHADVPKRTSLNGHKDINYTWVFTITGTIDDTITAETIISNDDFVTEKLIAADKVAVEANP